MRCMSVDVERESLEMLMVMLAVTPPAASTMA